MSLTVLILAVCQPVLAAGGDAGGGMLLNGRLDYFHDPGGRLGIGDVADCSAGVRFVRLREDQVRFGFAPGTHWFRLPAAALPQTASRLIEAGTPSMDSVTLHIDRPGGLRESMTAGDMEPFSERVVQSRRLVFPLPDTLPPTATLYIEAHSRGPVRMPVRLWQAADFAASDARDSAWLGLFAGVFIAMILYNFVLFLSVRDKAYLGYVTFWSAFLLVQMTFHGVAQPLLWPDAAGISNGVTLMALGCVVGFGSWFTRLFFNLPQHLPRFVPAFRLLFQAGIGGALLAWVLPYALLLRILLGLAVLLMVATAWVTAAAWRQGSRPARFLAVALATITPGMVLSVGVSSGNIPESEMVLRFIQLSVMAEPFVFALSLASRIKTLRDDLHTAEVETLRLRERFSIDLLEQQERSRRSIAQNLHDSVGQGLLVLLNRIKRLQRAVPESAARVLDDMNEVARNTIGEVRSICHDLHPHQLERLGLDNALRSMLTELFQGSGIELALDLVPVRGLLTPETEIQLFRLAQEAASNVIRHSGAASCDVILQTAGESLRLVVADDGRGLQPASGSGRQLTGFGMTTMHERVRAMGGDLALESEPREGVTLTATIPLSQRDGKHGANHHRG